jgi:hypothetical protein
MVVKGKGSMRNIAFHRGDEMYARAVACRVTTRTSAMSQGLMDIMDPNEVSWVRNTEVVMLRVTLESGYFFLS